MSVERYHAMGLSQWGANPTRLDKGNTEHLKNVRGQAHSSLGAISSSLWVNNQAPRDPNLNSLETLILAQTPGKDTELDSSCPPIRLRRPWLGLAVNVFPTPCAKWITSFNNIPKEHFTIPSYIYTYFLDFCAQLEFSPLKDLFILNSCTCGCMSVYGPHACRGQKRMLDSWSRQCSSCKPPTVLWVWWAKPSSSVITSTCF